MPARSDAEAAGSPAGGHGTGGPTAHRTHTAPAAAGEAPARAHTEGAGAPAGRGRDTGGPTAHRTHTAPAAAGGSAGAAGGGAGEGGAAPGGAGAALAGGGAAGQVLERALARAYGRLPEDRQRLLRRLTLAGRASFGPSAAAALIGTGPVEAARLLHELARAGLLDHVRGERFRMHDAVRAYASARLAADGDRAGAAAAHGRLIRDYAQLADAVIRMVDGQMSMRSGHFGGHGFASLEAALRWLDEESSFITAALRHAGDVDDLQAVLDLLGALCDFCLLRGDLYRLGEIDELTRAVEAARRGRPGEGRLVRSVQWRTGIAARQLGELDRARTTLSSVVDQYREARQDAGAAMALVSLGITLHHQGRLRDAAARIREALELQAPAELAGDRAWALHALAAVERDSARLAEALGLLRRSLALHREYGSVHGEAWAQFQLGQVYLRLGEVPQAEEELHRALDLYGRTRDDRGRAWAMTQLGRARVVDGDPGPAVERLREALARHREAEDARGEAWTLYYLGQALEEAGEPDEAVRELERARTMFSRMRDVYGLAHARHHSGRVTRDLRAARTGSLRNSGFARQLLVDARADFRRIGLAHGEAWTCLELAVVDAGNDRTAQALDLCEEAARLFISYGDRRGEDWARFMRCTLLPYAAPGGGAEEARAELARLSGAPHPVRDGRLADCLDAYAVVLARGVDPAEGWQGWRLSMVPDLHAQEVMGVPMPPAA
ncbi:tetratricopeptide repeat protein [Streptomyces toxytricini]